jgi:hypothetical protein
MEILIEKLDLLIDELKKNEKGSYCFFESIRKDLLEGNIKIATDKILPSYSITQYGDFSFYEEKLFVEIHNIFSGTNLNKAD